MGDYDEDGGAGCGHCAGGKWEGRDAGASCQGIKCRPVPSPAELHPPRGPPKCHQRPAATPAAQASMPRKTLPPRYRMNIMICPLRSKPSASYVNVEKVV